MGRIFFITMMLYCLPRLVFAQNMVMPDKLEDGGSVYARDPSWDEYAEQLRADIDGDGQDEGIVRFRSKEGAQDPLAVTAIYDLDKDKESLVRVITGGETPKEMELADVDKDGIQDLVLFDHCGNHYTLISIYSYKDNGYKLLFKNGTACYFYKVDGMPEKAQISKGREN